MDLIIRNAQLLDQPAGTLRDVGIQGGKIVAIEPSLTADAQNFDAGGRLACAGLIETHIHLDKGRLNDVLPPEIPEAGGRKIAPVPYARKFKPQITEEDVYRRAEQTLRQCLIHGTTRVRSHVEVDPWMELRGFNAVASLVDAYKWAVDLELCVFPQDGLTNLPGTDALLVQALKRGIAKTIGGAPRYDTDRHAQIRRIFALAHEYDLNVDFHLDVGIDPGELDVLLVCELTDQYKLGGRVTCGHMTKLSAMSQADLVPVARRLADAGVNITVLTATELYLMGRDTDHNVPRGVADLHFLTQHGVTCSVSSNNVLNPATPLGDCSLIRMASMHANIAQRGLPEELRECFAMVTERSAKILCATDYGIKVGNPADVAVIDARTPEQAVAEICRPVAVFKRGRRTVTWHPPELSKPQ